MVTVMGAWNKMEMVDVVTVMGARTIMKITAVVGMVEKIHEFSLQRQRWSNVPINAGVVANDYRTCPSTRTLLLTRTPTQSQPTGIIKIDE